MPDQIARFVPASFTALGTDAAGIVVAVLSALADAGTIDPDLVAKALADMGAEPDD